MKKVTWGYLMLCAALALATAWLLPDAMPAEAPGFTPYGVVLGAACGLALLWLRLRLGAQLSAKRSAGLALGLWAGALLGAQLLWRLVSLESVLLDWGAPLLWRLDLGGATLWGALLGALGALAVWCRVARRSFGAAADALVLPACLLLCAGRLAEYFTAQGLGGEVELEALRFFPLAQCVWDDGEWSQWQVPVYFWEALTAALLPLLLRRGAKAAQRPGRAAERFLCWLCAAQMLLEQMRQDDFLRFGFVRFGQLAALAILLALLWLRVRREGFRACLAPVLTLLACALAVIAAEFAFDKPLALPWLAAALALTAAAACWLWWPRLRHRPLWAALTILPPLALAVLLLLRLEAENLLLYLAIGWASLWMGLAVDGARGQTAAEG